MKRTGEFVVWIGCSDYDDYSMELISIWADYYYYCAAIIMIVLLIIIIIITITIIIIIFIIVKFLSEIESDITIAIFI
jgi:heme/copper-type cytochrome/quinol oxidase subunit 2